MHNRLVEFESGWRLTLDGVGVLSLLVFRRPFFVCKPFVTLRDSSF